MQRIKSILFSLAGILVVSTGSAQPTLAWSNRYDGPTGRYDNAQITEVDSAGNTYLLGLEVDNGATGGNPQPVVMKVGPDGSHQWTAAPDPDFGAGHLPKRAAVTADALYVTGTIPATGPFGTGVNKATVWKFRASDGLLIWRRSYLDAPFADSIAQDIAIDPNGNIAICGSLYNDSGFFPGNDAFIQKYDASGNRLWSTIHAEPINGFSWGQGFHFIKSDQNGDFIVAGTHSMGAPSELLAFKYSGLTGAKLWDFRYSGSVSASPNTLLLASNGDPVIAVNTQLTIENETRSRIGFIRIAGATGSELWTRIETLPLFYQLQLMDQVALDSNDNVIATLMYDTDGNALAPFLNNNSMRTFKFNGQTGLPVWTVDHGNNIRNDYQLPRTIQADAEGNVYVVGFETLPDPNLGLSRHTMIRRHDANTGEVTWYEMFVGEGHESPFRVRFDGSGNMIIAGTSYSEATSQDFWVSKWQVPSQAPNLTTINPSSVFVDQGAFDLTISGSNFVNGQSIIYWNDIPQPTTFVNSNQLTATIANTTNQTIGLIPIKVVTGTHSSNAINLQARGVVAPTSFAILTGLPSSGGLNELIASDDLRLRIRPDFTGARTNPNIVVEGTFPAPVGSPAELQFKAELLATAGPNDLKIQGFDFVSNAWVDLITTTTTTTDSNYVHSVTTDTHRYISGGQMKMRVWIRARSANGTRSWEGQIDRMCIQVHP